MLSFEAGLGWGTPNQVVFIHEDGFYKIELTALMSLNKFQHRVEVKIQKEYYIQLTKLLNLLLKVYKKSFGGYCDPDTVILGLYSKDMENVVTVSKVTKP